MTFTPKSWGNFLSGGTPLTGAALIDLETRLAAYADLAAGGGGIAPFYNVRSYGATGNGVTDDTNAIEACIAAAAAAFQAGGSPPGSNPFPYGSVVICFPPGEYVIRHPIQFMSRVVVYGSDPRHCRIRARIGADGGFSGQQMFRNWRDSDWSGLETDHRRAPQQMQAGSLDNVYPRISGFTFLPMDNTNLACISWAGANETSWIKDCIFQNPFGGSGNTGNWGIDLQDTRILGGGHFNIAEMLIDHIHFYGGGWERKLSFNNSNVTDGSAPSEYGQDLWINNCSSGWDSNPSFHSELYLNKIQAVTVTNCMWEANDMGVGAHAVIYSVNVRGLSFIGGNWDFLTPKGRAFDFLNHNVADGKADDRAGVSVRDITIATGGNYVQWFTGGAAMIRDPYHTIQPDSGTYGQAQPTFQNPMAHIRNLDEGIVDIRLIDGTIGRLDNAAGTITGVTDVQLNQHYLSCPGTLTNFQGFTTPDAAGFDLTTGCDLRVLVQPTSWTGTYEQWLVEKFTSGQRSYSFAITAAGRLEFYYSVDGSSSINLTSSAGPVTTNAVWLRVVVDALTGAQTTATFYTSTNGASWTTLGTPQVGAVGPFFSGSSPVSVAQNENSATFNGKLYRAEIRNLAGTLVGYLDARGLVTHQTYTDSLGHLWTPDILAVVSTEQILNAALIPSGFVIPGVQADVADTTGATVAALETSVNSLKAALRNAGVLA